MNHSSTWTHFPTALNQSELGKQGICYISRKLNNKLKRVKISQLPLETLLIDEDMAKNSESKDNLKEK